MQEVLNKIDELVSLLENKIKQNEKVAEGLQLGRKELEAANIKLEAKANHISAMERIYQKYADFDAEKTKFNLEKVDYNKQITLAKKQEDNDAEMLASINKAKEELKVREASLSRKVLAFKEREVNFDKKREELKGLISGETLKDILK